jgi:hypothetical protein
MNKMHYRYLLGAAILTGTAYIISQAINPRSEKNTHESNDYTFDNESDDDETDDSYTGDIFRYGFSPSEITDFEDDLSCRDWSDRG